MNRFTQLDKLLNQHPELGSCAAELLAAHDLLVDCYRQGGKLLVCGNGGSAADSEHIVAELMKGFNLLRPLPETARQKLVQANPETGVYLADHLQVGLPTISLVSQTALLSAFGNDVAADLGFAQQVYGYGQPGDALLGLSTSGRSKNVLYALQTARALGLGTLALLGAQGGPAVELCDVAICVPALSTPEIQEQHMAVYHTLCAMLEETFFRPPQAAGQPETAGSPARAQA